MFGAENALFASWLNQVDDSSGGVPAGATSPNQALISSGMPCSISVGTSGSAELRSFRCHTKRSERGPP